MRTIYVFIIWIAAGAFMSPVQASNIMLDVMKSHDFYRSFPKQGLLAEQFASVVTSLPNAIKVAQTEPIKIAILLFGEADSTENTSLLLAFKRRMRELRIDYRLDTYVDKSLDEWDVEPYLKLESARPDYLVMTKMGAIQRRFLERFLRSDHTKIIVYDFASPFNHWMNHAPLMYIGFDQEKAAKKLASYLNRQLPPESVISALILPNGYLSHARCDAFLDEMSRYGREVHYVREVADNKQAALQSTRALLDESATDFIFSCSQSISEGVIAALKERASPEVETNTWGPFSPDFVASEGSWVKVGVLFMADDLSIAVAEAIKFDLEGKNMPTLYVASTHLMPTELGVESLFLMTQQAYRYSAVLWEE